MVFNLREETEYIEKCKDKSKKGTFLYYLTKKRTIIEFSAFIILLYIMPDNAGTAPIGDLLFHKGVSLLDFLIITPVFLVIFILAKCSAANEFRKSRTFTRRQRTMKEIYLGILLGISYLGSGITFAYMIPPISAFLPLIKQILLSETTIIIIFLIAFVISCIYLGAILKRKATISKIQKNCKRLGYRMSAVKSPIKSLFTPVDGESFSVRCGKEVYSCKLISGLYRATPIIFSDNGQGAYEKSIRFFKSELGRHYTNFEYDYKADGLKILIITPVPKKVFKEFGGRRYPLDNGDSVSKYKIHTVTSFLNSLERGCLDR